MTDDITIKSPHKNFEAVKKIDENGVEYWEARELMTVLGYEEWRKFDGVIGKAKLSCRESGQKVGDHFVGADKMIKIAVGRPACHSHENGNPENTRYGLSNQVR